MTSSLNLSFFPMILQYDLGFMVILPLYILFVSDLSLKGVDGDFDVCQTSIKKIFRNEKLIKKLYSINNTKLR